MSVSREVDFPKVRTFLESIGRNSLKTKYAYEMGLKHLQRFLPGSSYSNFNVETVLQPLQNGTVDAYQLIDGFVSYLVSLRQNGGDVPLAPTTVTLQVYAIRSYLQYYDIDINPSKFRRKVRLPKAAREDEEPIDGSDIRKILLACNNRRLKAYILVLASGGMRATEGLAIRYKDLDFNVSPTKVHIRKEYAKTRVAREIYVSDEATMFLKRWLDWKYREDRIIKNGKRTTSAPMPDDLVFSPFVGSNPDSMYQKMIVEYRKILEVVGLGERKDNSFRRKITLHSMRRFVKSTIADATNQDFSEWFLGHKKSPYYVKKEQELREIYRTKCMRYLTFLDYSALETSGRDIEAKLEEKDMQIRLLEQRDFLNKDALTVLADRLLKLEARIASSQSDANVADSSSNQAAV